MNTGAWFRLLFACFLQPAVRWGDATSSLKRRRRFSKRIFERATVKGYEVDIRANCAELRRPNDISQWCKGVQGASSSNTNKPLKEHQTNPFNCPLASTAEKC